MSFDFDDFWPENKAAGVGFVLTYQVKVLKNDTICQNEIQL